MQAAWQPARRAAGRWGARTGSVPASSTTRPPLRTAVNASPGETVGPASAGSSSPAVKPTLAAVDIGSRRGRTASPPPVGPLEARDRGEHLLQDLR